MIVSEPYIFTGRCFKVPSGVKGSCVTPNILLFFRKRGYELRSIARQAYFFITLSVFLLRADSGPQSLSVGFAAFFDTLSTDTEQFPLAQLRTSLDFLEQDSGAFIFVVAAA